MRHSLAHLLAAAVMQMWPDAKRTIGPAIENGFYFDFQFQTPISEKDLPKIEARMRKILPSWKSFERIEMGPEKAKSEFSQNPFKQELIDEFAKNGETLSFYKSGEYSDLCRGGHVANPAKEIAPDAFKLTKLAGSYWRGNEKNPMLTRVYGVAFNTKAELDEYLAMQKEAEKRDHRKLGQELDLFTFSDQVGKGLPLFTPRGAYLRERLTEYSERIRAAKGWQTVWSPHITKNDLYKTSGHWAKFGKELFLVKSQETKDELVMKPMNCPHHQQIYASRPRSYKELPLKYMETTTVYRDEKAGELLGLSRVRSITQDDSHTFCRPDQIEQIYKELIQVTKAFYKTIGMPLRARLSFRDPKAPEKYLGDPKLWEKAQFILLKIIKSSGIDYFIAEGEAAFYGPKIDFMATDALGREWQLATPQLDFVQPERFGLRYTDEEGRDQTPVMIHFALLGSVERFLSVYIEHTGGNFPLWLSPVHVGIIPVSSRHNAFATKLAREFSDAGILVETDLANETVGYKIRRATHMKIPYVIVLGDAEMKSSKLAVRVRGSSRVKQAAKKRFIEELRLKIEKRSRL